MKLKAVILALFVAGLTTSVALASDGHGKSGEHGKSAEHGAKAAALASSSSTTTTNSGDKGKGVKPCKPALQLEFAGTAAAAPTSDGALAVLVAKGRAGGQSLAGKQLTLDVSGAKVDGTLAKDAVVRVHARACVDVVALTVKLVATQVKVGGAKDGGDTTSTDETTSTD